MNYHNDHDPFACEWTRNLIEAGHIPPGVVDERPIEEVTPEDVAGYHRCHFFNGIAGWEYACRLAGWHGPLWTASLPCQPFSSAGKRQGVKDERHLWPVFFRLVRECRPDTVIGEQVASNDGYRWFDGVRADLESVGYAVGLVELPAACVGAPDIRQRLFWVARRLGDPDQPRADIHPERCPSRAATGESGTSDGLADTGRAGLRGRRQPLGGAAGRDQGEGNKRKRVRFDLGDGRDLGEAERRIIEECGFWPGCERTPEGGHAETCPGRKWGHRRPSQGDYGRLGDSNGERHDRRRNDGAIQADEGRWAPAEPSQASSDLGWLGDAVGAGPQGRRPGVRGGLFDRGSGEPPALAGGFGGVGDACGDGRDEGAAGPPRAEPDAGGPGADFWADWDFVLCRDPDDADRPRVRRVERGTFPLAARVPRDVGSLFPGVAGMAGRARSNRVGRLRGYGNAINPECAAHFLRAVKEILQ